MKRYTSDTLPTDAAYLGSTEGPDQISEFLADLLADAIAPAYIKDEDGHRHFFELCPQDFQPRAYSNEASFL
jgi:hypothetical protein